ncbi:hypothetical protein GMLC_14510 [Geomonas limicola]|uniref:Phage tail protein n=1 Tax=Geomonas limicola TaxID=2740186 RepID=A0A6V8N5N5_9BACT|nr:putative phage tail protein [Geomonas limicola]GFO67872.1 hypothetical protein GMLC_14510 [Geomonas limicola]
MSHKDALKLLIPVDLGATHELDIATEGALMDRAGDRAEILLTEQFPDGAYELLESWERNYGTAPFFDDSLQMRKARVKQKMSELGRLDRNYFIQLGAALGYDVVIEELHPFMVGWSGAGDEVGDDGSDWCWRVYYSEGGANVFRAGEGAAGEYLSYSFADTMRQIFEDLKPADTFVELIEA